jgi:type IV pilus assembly protein PilO
MSLLADLRNLDRHNIGGWPKSVRTFFIAAVFAVVAFLGWYLFVSDQQDRLDSLAAKEVQLKQEFSQKQAKAVNLEALQQQLDEMQDMLRQLLRQLPSKTEMPELLVDISQTALSAGLETELFQPGPETPKDFYAEKPIQLRMIGTYHQFGAFISGVASLPRVVILTLHDVSLSPLGKDGKAVAAPAAGTPAAAAQRGDGRLVLQGTVKTYRYLEDDENGGGKVPAKGGKAPAKARTGGAK